ncbi:MAG TPA: hypothetical protein VF079_06090 [Sphingomicrobium sp.]
MSEVAIGARQESDSVFKRGTMLLIVAIGTLAFIATLVLGAYAPDMRSGKNGGAHALSNAATGFSGLVRLAERTDRNPVILRSEGQLDSEDLVIITPETARTNLGDILAKRGDRITLIVLPKWNTQRDPMRPAWVRVGGLLPRYEPEGVLAPDWELKVERRRTANQPLQGANDLPAGIAFVAPRIEQTISGDKLDPVITDADGRILLGRSSERLLYVLADPDLLNNHGMGDERQAKAALALLDYLSGPESGGILFDVTANGLGHSRSPLKLAFDPPFLAVTLTIFAAMLLAGLQALFRFGAPRRAERALAFGKAALVDNSAALIRRAGREPRLGARYAEVIRERAAALFRLGPSTSRELVDARLEALNSRTSFTALAAAAANAHSRDDLLGAAQSLHHWIEEVQE